MHHRNGWPNLPPSLGTKGWVLGSNLDSLMCISLCVPSGMQCKGPGPGPPGVKLCPPWEPGTWEDASPAALVPNLCAASPLQYRAGEPFKLSACRGKHGTVATHTAVCCYPATLLPCRPGQAWGPV